MRFVQKPSGFALKELLVVTAVIAVVIALLSVSVRRAQITSQRSTCSNNLKGLGVGLHMYHDARGTFPCGTVGNSSLLPEMRWSWHVSVVNASTSEELLIDLDNPWDADRHHQPQLVQWSVGPTVVSSTSRPLSDVPTFRCPVARNRLLYGVFDTTSYIGVAGIGADAPSLSPGDLRIGVFGYDRATKLNQITDGTAYTIMLIESELDNGPLLAGGPSTVRGIDQSGTPYLGRNRQFFGFHPSGGNVLFVDGSIRFLSDDTEDAVLEGLSTIAANDGPDALDD